MKTVQFESYLMGHEMKPIHEEILYRIGPVYAYNEETEKYDKETEVDCLINMGIMTNEVQGLADKEIQARFIHEAINEYADYHGAKIGIMGAKEFFSKYGTVLNMEVQEVIEYNLTLETPETLAKILKKSMNSYDLSRLIEALSKENT